MVNTTGSTEMCTLPFYGKEDEDWAYFHFNPLHKGIEFRAVGDGYVRYPISNHHPLWYKLSEL